MGLPCVTGLGEVAGANDPMKPGKVGVLHGLGGGGAWFKSVTLQKPQREGKAIAELTVT